MKPFFLILYLLFSHNYANAQVNIEYGIKGHYNNSIRLLKAMSNIYDIDSLALWVESNNKNFVCVLNIDSIGHVTDIPTVWEKGKIEVNKKNRLEKLLKKSGQKFSIIIINEFGENEESLTKKIYPDIKQLFLKNERYTISVGFPGYIRDKIKEMKKVENSNEPLSTKECINRILQTDL